jgi:hypothetical protein
LFLLDLRIVTNHENGYWLKIIIVLVFLLLLVSISISTKTEYEDEDDMDNLKKAHPKTASPSPDYSASPTV